MSDPIYRPDEPLTPHFSLYELTATSNAALQEANRTLDDDQVLKLGALASFLETLRGVVNRPIRVHSGYRAAPLNAATLGSSSTSQHPRCEAADFDVPGQSVEDTFTALLAAARAGQFKFGQLILEYADRGYKNDDGSEALVKWVHASLVGTLNPDHVGQVLKMQAGEDGVPHYFLVERIAP